MTHSNPKISARAANSLVSCQLGICRRRCHGSGVGLDCRPIRCPSTKFPMSSHDAGGDSSTAEPGGFVVRCGHESSAIIASHGRAAPVVRSVAKPEPRMPFQTRAFASRTFPLNSRLSGIRDQIRISHLAWSLLSRLWWLLPRVRESVGTVCLQPRQRYGCKRMCNGRVWRTPQ